MSASRFRFPLQLQLLVFLGLVSVLGLGFIVLPSKIELSVREAPLALQTAPNGDLSVFSHSVFTLESDLAALQAFAATPEASYAVQGETLVLSSQLRVVGAAAASLDPLASKSLLYAARLSSNATVQDIDTESVQSAFNAATNDYNVTLTVRSYFARSAFRAHEDMVARAQVTQYYFESSVLSGMTRILLREGDTLFGGAAFAGVRSVSFADQGSALAYPPGYNDEGELLSRGDKAAIVIMSLLGAALLVAATYYLIVVFRAYKQTFIDALLQESEEQEQEKELQQQKQ